MQDLSPTIRKNTSGPNSASDLVNPSPSLQVKERKGGFASCKADPELRIFALISQQEEHRLPVVLAWLPAPVGGA